LKKTTLFLAFTLITTLAGYSQARFDWPCWRGPNGDGVSLETGWNPKALDDPRVIWSAEVGVGYANVAIQGGRLVTMGTDAGTLVVCLDAETGKRLWDCPIESLTMPQATPFIDGSEVYALAGNGILVRLDSRTGAPVWRRNLVSDFGAQRPKYTFAGSPIVRGDLVLLTANLSGMAVRRDTGELAWASARPPGKRKCEDADDFDYTSPVVHDGGSRVLTCGGGAVHCLRPADGTVVWSYRWPESCDFLSVDPVPVGTRVLVSRYDVESQGASLIETAGDAPRLLWQNAEMCSQVGEIVVLGGFAYCSFGGLDARKASLRCLDLADGRILWEQTFDSSWSQPAVSLSAADGKLIVLSDTGCLSVAAAGPKGYQEISQCELKYLARPGSKKFWAAPVLCGGRLYVRSVQGEILCIDMR
jgi:outer membrane protein assembly factor BamB